jgi:hypothetical protein
MSMIFSAVISVDIIEIPPASNGSPPTGNVG